MGRDGDLVGARLARGCRCFVIRQGGELAAYGWLSAGREWIGELDLEITPGPAEAYVWNCVTMPAFRRKGMFKALLAGINALARREGLKRMWIGSVAIPAERAVGPSGFSPALLFRTARIGPFLYINVAPPAGGEPPFAERAQRVLGKGGQPLRLGRSLRLSRSRRH